MEKGYGARGTVRRQMTKSGVYGSFYTSSSSDWNLKAFPSAEKRPGSS